MRSGDEEKEEKEKEEKRRRGRGGAATDIKSNNPHLAGGEKMSTAINAYKCYSVVSIISLAVSCLLVKTHQPKVQEPRNNYVISDIFSDTPILVWNMAEIFLKLCSTENCHTLHDDPP